MSIHADDIERWFTHHPPADHQVRQYETLRTEAKALAHTILALTPACADRGTAIRKLRECIMAANAAIACAE